MAPPFREVEFEILYGEGISQLGDLLECATKYNVVEKSGTWFTYQDERMGQGRENARNWLKENPKHAATIRKAVLERSGITGRTEDEPAPARGAAATTSSKTAAPARPASARGRAPTPTKGK